MGIIFYGSQLCCNHVKGFDKPLLGLLKGWKLRDHKPTIGLTQGCKNALFWFSTLDLNIVHKPFSFKMENHSQSPSFPIPPNT
jgi:hypothetical protein